jgi:ribose-phosphate pyrophosphokinase
MSKLRIFAGSPNIDLAKEIRTYMDIELNRLYINTFSHGNLSVQILENVREKDVFMLQSFTEPVNRNII